MMETPTAAVALRTALAATIVGQQRQLDRLIVALLAGGHVLVEGLPGLAKTTAVKALAGSVQARFRRIQFTPDLLPGDLTGTEIYDPRASAFHFAPGPLFHEIVLADEINRAPAKVQSALLEAMQERQITVAGVTHPLPELFMVMATQNPIEQAGTYPLPEAQLDRFMLHVTLDYPGADDEREILRRDHAALRGDRPVAPPPVLDVAGDAAAVREQEDRIGELVRVGSGGFVFARNPASFVERLITARGIALRHFGKAETTDHGNDTPFGAEALEIRDKMIFASLDDAGMHEKAVIGRFMQNPPVEGYR